MDIQQEVSTHFSVADNYWDKLPPEIQEYIWKHKVHFEPKEKMQKLCKEIKHYSELREKWSLGFIHICRPFLNPDDYPQKQTGKGEPLNFFPMKPAPNTHKTSPFLWFQLHRSETVLLACCKWVST